MNLRKSGAVESLSNSWEEFAEAACTLTLGSRYPGGASLMTFTIHCVLCLLTTLWTFTCSHHVDQAGPGFANDSCKRSQGVMLSDVAKRQKAGEDYTSFPGATVLWWSSELTSDSLQ